LGTVRKKLVKIAKMERIKEKEEKIGQKFEKSRIKE